jgi:hypothetical protein
MAASNATFDTITNNIHTTKPIKHRFSIPLGFAKKTITKNPNSIKGEGARFAAGLILALIGVAMVLLGLSIYSMALFYAGLIVVIIGGGILGIGLWFNI